MSSSRTQCTPCTITTNNRPNLLEETVHTLKNLDTMNIKVEFLFVPSHINLSGNDMVDLAAKQYQQGKTPMSNTAQLLQTHQRHQKKSGKISNESSTEYEQAKPLYRQNSTKHIPYRINIRTECQHCQSHETLHHILIECSKYHHQRKAMKEYQVIIGSPTTYPDKITYTLIKNIELKYKNIIKYLKAY
ncbi:hypothetical protein CHS0354_023115, partial [Potamilus streckersoni]